MSESHFWSVGHKFRVGKADGSYSPVCEHRLSFRYARIFTFLSFSFECVLYYISLPLGGTKMLYRFCTLLGHEYFHPGIFFNWCSLAKQAFPPSCLTVISRLHSGSRKGDARARVCVFLHEEHIDDSALTCFSIRP